MAGPLRATLFVLLFLSHAATADVPVETFFRPADMEDAALSPSGRWLALTSVGSGARVALFVFDLSEMNRRARSCASPTPTFATSDGRATSGWCSVWWTASPEGATRRSARACIRCTATAATCGHS